VSFWAQVYVLADTTYNSLSVDEVAASHVDAQCVVHYGRASLTALSRLPAFFVFPRRPLDAEAAAEALAGSELMASCAADGATVVVLLDQPHLEQLPALRAALRRRRRPGAAGAGAALVFADVPTRHLDPASLSTCGAGPSPAGCCAAARPPGSAAAAGEQRAAGYTWALPAGADPACCAFAWVGDPSAPALSELQLSRSGARWASFDPGAGALREGLPPEVGRALGRRYYLVERARNASIVGILVGTLGVAGYRGAADALRAAARRAGKRTYTLLMGKPSPAKLANFPEIEVRGGGWCALRRARRLGSYKGAGAGAGAGAAFQEYRGARRSLRFPRGAGVCDGGRPPGSNLGQQGVPGAHHHPARGHARLHARRRLGARRLPPRLRGRRAGET
jgi:diphthamide biosynthesis protein 2